MIPNRPYSEVWREAADHWTDLDNAARLLEETKSAVLSKWMTEEGDVAVSKAELRVKASDRWKRFVESVVNARTAADKAKIEMKYREMQYFEGQSKAATERVEARF